MNRRFWSGFAVGMILVGGGYALAKLSPDDSTSEMAGVFICILGLVSPGLYLDYRESGIYSPVSHGSGWGAWVLGLIIFFVPGAKDVKPVPYLNGAVMVRACKVQEIVWVKDYVRFQFERPGSYTISFKTLETDQYGHDVSDRGFTHQVVDPAKDEELAVGALGMGKVQVAVGDGARTETRIFDLRKAHFAERPGSDSGDW